MDYEVIVVGGGIGGLATAALLASRGVDVCLFERQSRAGGCVADYEHAGYTFEPTAGLYSGWQSGGVWEQIFSELPLSPPPVSKLSPSYVVRLPDRTDVAVSVDHDHFEEDLSVAFPDCASAAINFFRELDQIGSAADRDQVVANLLNATSAEFRLFVDVQLQTLVQRTSAECSMLRAAAAFGAVRHGMWAIEGGGQALADRLAESLKQCGGLMRLDAPVLRLAYATDGTPVGIDLLSGERVMARRAIISNLTIWDTYGKLVGLARTPRSISAELKNSNACGAYLMFLGMDEAARERLAANRMMLITETSDDAYLPYRQQLTVNVTSGSPTRAPAGKVPVTVSAFTLAEDWFTFHEDETSHEAQDQATLENCWTRLHAAIPELGDAVEVIETATPRTFYESTRRKFGMVGAPSVGLGGMSHGKSFGTTPFPNVFLVGDTVSDGLGLEGLATSAFSLANELAPQH